VITFFEYDRREKLNCQETYAAHMQPIPLSSLHETEISKESDAKALQKIDSLYNHKATRLRTNPKQKR
jgi:hypothetical protein